MSTASQHYASDNLRTGGQILVDCLRQQAVERAFAVPGESYLAVLDAFYDITNIELITCRQESGAAMMAEAYGKLTGRPGICFVTRGPGATNASAGVHIARQDSTPMILFIGQVGRDMLDREAFQEVDYRRMYGQLAKWVAQIDDAARIPEYISRAFHTATSGRAGPVVLALPEDMLRDRVAVDACKPYHVIQAHPGQQDLHRLHELLSNAKHPLILIGEGDWNTQARTDLQRFAEQNRLPVSCTFRCQDLFDNSHPNYIGDLGLGSNPKLIERVKNADVLLAIGGRLGEIPTNSYTLLNIPSPQQCLLHVHPGADELNRVYRAELAINASMQTFTSALNSLPTINSPSWADATAQGHDDYLAWIEPPTSPGELQFGQVMKYLRERLPDNAILTNGAGNYTVWLHRFYQYKYYRSQLAPTSGSMGYGLPAAVAAKLQHPERPVICFAGDGCYQMTMQEFGTAVQFGANIIVLVINNGSWGTIRMHQERAYPGRVKATEIINPDFAALAKAYGAYGITISNAADFPTAFEQAFTANTPAIIELVLDLEALTPKASLSEIRQASLAAQSKA